MVKPIGEEETMSYYDYQYAKWLELKDPPFYALIQCAIRRADTDNGLKLKRTFPKIWEELYARYNAPGGYMW